MFKSVKSGSKTGDPQSKRRSSLQARLRRMLPLPEVKEGNSQADWDLWHDSVAAYEAQFSSSEDDPADQKKG